MGECKIGVSNISIHKAAEAAKQALRANGVKARATITDNMALVYGSSFTFAISPCRRRPQGVGMHIVEGGDFAYRLYDVALAAIEKAAAN